MASADHPQGVRRAHVLDGCTLALLEIDARQPREGRHCERQNGHGRLRPEERARITSSQKSKWRVTQPFTMRDRNRLWYMPATWKATFASGPGLRGHRSSGPRWEPLPDIRLPSDMMADRWKTGASPKLRMAHGTTVDRRGLVTFTVKLPPKVMSCLKMSLQPCARPCEGPRKHFIRKQTGP